MEFVLVSVLANFGLRSQRQCIILPYPFFVIFRLVQCRGLDFFEKCVAGERVINKWKLVVKFSKFCNWGPLLFDTKE